MATCAFWLEMVLYMLSELEQDDRSPAAAPLNALNFLKHDILYWSQAWYKSLRSLKCICSYYSMGGLCHCPCGGVE